MEVRNLGVWFSCYSLVVVLGWGLFFLLDVVDFRVFIVGVMGLFCGISFFC